MDRTRSSGVELEDVSRRERQIMDILIEMGEATAEDVRARLPNPPSYSAARALLSRLEQKGLVAHTLEEHRYVFAPTVSPVRVRESAMSRLIRVFFRGSVARAVTGLVTLSPDDMTDEELEEIAKVIDDTRRKRRRP